MVRPCPHCGNPLEGLGTFCWTCKRYTDEGGSCSEPAPAEAIPDTRSEDERKADARPAMEALGWLVIDTEQGYRPHHCPACQHKIPGGTRTTLGMADWLCLKDGRAAFVEWKSADGRQTPHQRAFQDASDAVGVPYRVCRTTEQAVNFLQETSHA